MHKKTPKPIDDDNATSIEEPKGYSSPPCQRHEIDPAYGGDLDQVIPMKYPDRVFHLAIPCADLNAAREFYVNGLGCRFARAMEDRITLDFFGGQLVCHLYPEAIDPDPEIYPRHFGMTFQHRAEFDQVLERAKAANLVFFKEPFIRFEGRSDEHQAFFLKDPSNNLVEFKFYRDPELMY